MGSGWLWAGSAATNSDGLAFPFHAHKHPHFKEITTFLLIESILSAVASDGFACFRSLFAVPAFHANGVIKVAQVNFQDGQTSVGSNAILPL
jgi:hypothetical protein